MVFDLQSKASRMLFALLTMAVSKEGRLHLQERQLERLIPPYINGRMNFVWYNKDTTMQIQRQECSEKLSSEVPNGKNEEKASRGNRPL